MRLFTLCLTTRLLYILYICASLIFFIISNSRKKFSKIIRRRRGTFYSSSAIGWNQPTEIKRWCLLLCINPPCPSFILCSHPFSSVATRTLGTVQTNRNEREAIMGWGLLRTSSRFSMYFSILEICTIYIFYMGSATIESIHSGLLIYKRCVYCIASINKTKI